MRVVAGLIGLALVAVGTGCDVSPGGGKGETGEAPFEFKLPDGWSDQTDSEVVRDALREFEETAGQSLEAEIAIVGPPRDEFAPNLIVYRGASGVDGDASDYLREVASEEDEFAREHPELAPKEELPPQEIRFGGESAVQRDFLRPPLRERQIVVVKDGTVHYLSFTALEKHFDEDVRVLRRIGRSWRWK
ncbi:MAG TPA: hypothetical protein VHF45_08120 [Thermoleophilaceae bacterium]|nr:hypothetical protein [Thermoleophilaceae bacterium]